MASKSGKSKSSASSRSAKKSSSRPKPIETKGVDRSQEGTGGPTMTGSGETSVNVDDESSVNTGQGMANIDRESGGQGMNIPSQGLEDIGGTGIDMDEGSDDMDFDENLNRPSGNDRKQPKDDEDFD